MAQQQQPKITTKGITVTLRRMGNKTFTGIGYMPTMDSKAIKQTPRAVKVGGFRTANSEGAEYFESACNTMRELLKSRLD